ncbi:MAG: Crp/Fnr family transcriptional regulator [Bryobacterales bacterium]|nr:Crp/Fnr family transcriptional regulator [Bryobacterales bacterium]
MSASPRTIETLRRVRIFSALSDQEIEEVAAHARPRSYAPGQVIFLEGDACEGMFLISDGKVRVFKTSPSGREMLLTMEQAPASVAEIPVFDGGPYPASAAAVTAATVYLIPRQDFAALCRRNPEVGLKVLAVVGKRLRTLVSSLHQITFGSVRQRLAQSLLDLAEQGGSSPVELPETREQLATRLGTVREVLSRNLSRFQAQGFIRIEQRRIWIDDPEGLREEASLEMH